jgi:hypothetical protein
LLIDAHCTIGYAFFATARWLCAAFEDISQARKKKENELWIFWSMGQVLLAVSMPPG